MGKNYTYLKCSDCVLEGRPECRHVGYRWPSCVIPGCTLEDGSPEYLRMARKHEAANMISCMSCGKLTPRDKACLSDGWLLCGRCSRKKRLEATLGSDGKCGYTLVDIYSLGPREPATQCHVAHYSAREEAVKAFSAYMKYLLPGGTTSLDLAGLFDELLSSGRGYLVVHDGETDTLFVKHQL